MASVATERDASAETVHGGVPPMGDGLSHEPDTLIDPKMAHSWREGEPRTFAALTLDAGYLYLRPRAHLGYGKPFWSWVGLEINPLVGAGGYGGYGGIRVNLPHVDLRVGARYLMAFQHAYLDPKASYNRLDLDVTVNDKARYYTLESELNVWFGLGPGDVLLTGSISAVENVPADHFVFEETLRVIVDPPLVWRARAGYLFRWGAHNQHSIGPVVDVLDVPKRDDSTTVRLGPVLRVQLSRHFDVRGSFVMPFVSPDRLGLVGGDFTELGVRYRVSTD